MAKTVKQAGVKTAGDGIPYAVRREIEEIAKNTGRTYQAVVDSAQEKTGIDDLIDALVSICDRANKPCSAWRDRWQVPVNQEAGSSTESAGE